MFTKLHMECLIELVRQNRGLYDQSLPTYKDNLWTQNTWTKIATKLGVEGVSGKLQKIPRSLSNSTFFPVGHLSYKDHTLCIQYITY